VQDPARIGGGPASALMMVDVLSVSAARGLDSFQRCCDDAIAAVPAMAVKSARHVQQTDGGVLDRVRVLSFAPAIRPSAWRHGR